VRALALLLLLLAAQGRAALPPSVAGLQPGLAEAERHLQDATLELEAARREAEPLQAEVTEARAHADTFWGAWRLRRHLARLKERLDKVETARVAQSRAREEVFTVLTGLEEELRGALESALLAKGRPVPKADLLAWWSQRSAWSRRVAALEAGSDERAEAGGEQRRRLLGEARAEQWQRDLALVDAMQRKGIMDAGQAKRERAALKAVRGGQRRAKAP
jgi:chromosome segregation ATPase